jgi:hypothetical protein
LQRAFVNRSATSEPTAGRRGLNGAEREDSMAELQQSPADPGRPDPGQEDPDQVDADDEAPEQEALAERKQAQSRVA